MKKGAYFNSARTLRWYLFRIWDESKPLVMFIGLNPSKADEEDNDPTITRVCSIAKHNGYGGVYMVNCFSHISTDSAGLIVNRFTSAFNNYIITQIAKKCKDVVFAWGSSNKIVNEANRLKELSIQFPNAKVLFINKDGNPKHPLYCPIESELIPYDSYISHMLLTKKDFTPNCGKDWCVVGGGPTKWDGKKQQFRCHCGWCSNYEKRFIKLYIERWQL